MAPPVSFEDAQQHSTDQQQGNRRRHCGAPAAPSPPVSARSNTRTSASPSTSSDSEPPADTGGNNSNSGEGSTNGANRKLKKKRKSTYLVRKDEIELLEKEAMVLESHMEVLRQREEGGQPTERELLNTALHETRRSQQLSFAGAQSAMSGFLNADPSNPLSTYVRLSKDWTQRRNAILGMKDKKIQDVYDYIRARSQFLDPFKPHHSEERFENANGDYCCAKFDITQFDGVESVKQVYNAILAFLVNIEISVSERLGVITVREDFDNVENTVTNFRLRSLQCGVDVESNIVTFAKYFENQHELSSGSTGGGPCAVFAGECVEEDELYPYSPKERARRDVTTAIVLTPHMRKKRNGGQEEEELVVVMAQYKFHKLHRNAELPPESVEELRENMSWVPVMVKVVKEQLRSEKVLLPVTQRDNPVQSIRTTRCPMLSASAPVEEPQLQQLVMKCAAAVAADAGQQDDNHHCCEAPAVSCSKRMSSSSFESELQVENSHGDSDGDGNVKGPSRKTRKKRKSTYLVRKNEMQLLEKEAKVLESRVEALKQQGQGEQGGQLPEQGLLNMILHEMHRNQQLSLAVAQSAVSGFLNADQSNPLSTRIHLGKDWDQRHKTLVTMKDKKISSAYEYVQARSQFLDPLKPHSSEERFENASGDFCCARFDIFQFEDVESVKQVYDALLSYLHTIEISVSERLGHITVREDFDSVENSATNFRLLSEQCGVSVESNIVTFTKYFENQHEALSNGGAGPFAVLTGECVDDDELYPYSPNERARRDVAVAIVLTPHMRKTRSGEGEELVVAMAQCKFHKLYNTALKLPPRTLQELRDNVCWAPVMVKTINELLRSETAFFAPQSDKRWVV